MIYLLLARTLAVKTVYSGLGELNYLYQKPENAARRFSYSISPDHGNLSIFLKVTGTLSDVQYTLSAETSTALQVSLLYKSAMGVDFQFVHFTYVCATCSRVVFTPVLLTDVLGLFWCQFTIPQMDFMIVPQQLALVGCSFKVDQFYMTKGRFHTVTNNTVLSNNIVKSTGYAMVGTTLDSSYAEEQAEFCISCKDTTYSPDSRCSCPSTGEMVAGECMQTSIVTEVIKGADGISYFLSCNAARNGFVEVNYSKTLKESLKIAVLNNDDCGIANILVKGEIQVKTESSILMNYAGLVYFAKKDISNVNTSLQIQQTGNGMGGTSLIALKNTMAIKITFVRISGVIISDGTPTREYTAMILPELGANVVIQNVGMFGGVINQTCNRSSFGVAITMGFQVTMIDIFLVPSLPPGDELIDTMYIESSAWIDESFPCYKQSSYEMQLSLKMKQYLENYEGSMTYPKLISNPGTTELGGLVSFANGSVTNLYKRIISIIDINNAYPCQLNTGDTCEGIGLFFGKAEATLTLESAYAQGNVTFAMWRSGMIGSLGAKDEIVDINITMAGSVNISCGTEMGAIGSIFQGNHRLYILGNVSIRGSSLAGFIGLTAGGRLSLMLVGMIESNVTDSYGYVLGAYVMSEIIPADLYVNGIKIPLGSKFNTLGGCSVNECTDEKLDSRAVITTNSLVRVDEGGWVNFHLIPCETNKKIVVNTMESLSAEASMRVMQDGSCTPTNLEISGELTISTVRTGTHAVSLSGFLRTLTTTLAFINTSMIVKHTNYNGTEFISLIAWNTSIDVEISLVRISGYIQGETGTQSAVGRISGTLICTLNNKNIIISNIGIYGVQSVFGGTVASGIIGLVDGGTLNLNNILVVDEAEEEYLMSQLIYESFYYTNDGCANSISNDNISKSVNMKQYLDNFQVAQRTKYTYSIRTNQKVGGLIGQISGASVTASRIVVLMDLEVTVDTSEAGLLFGAASGTLQLLETYVRGNITGGTKISTAGAIGSLQSTGSVSMMAILEIQGSQLHGVIGQVSGGSTNVYVYFDSIINAQTLVGGIAGKIVAGASLTYYNIIGRTQFAAPGGECGKIVGSPLLNTVPDAVIDLC